MPPASLVGTSLGPYEVVALLGAGGMGEVYRARDTRIRREVAVKVLPAAFATDPGRLQRFEREARAIGALSHPALLVLHDVGTHQGKPFLVTELLEGRTLRSLLLSGPLPPRKGVELGVQLAQGLAAAHAKGILHRDIKPENVFVTSDGRIKILDFGLARLVSADERVGESAPTVTSPMREGTVLGTIGYMSPEQAEGREVDHRSDVFGLGTVLYEMLAGRPAFRRDTTLETLNAIVKEDPPSIAAAHPALAPALERLILRCLEKKPEERFQSCRDVAFALEALSGETGTRTASVAVGGRRGMWTALPLVAAIALGAAIGWGVGQERTPRLPVFKPLTFRRGWIDGARFAPNGSAVYYSAAWDGRAPEVFSTTGTGPESMALGTSRARVVAVSRTGDLAVILGTGGAYGTLATLPVSGGEPRILLEEVTSADFAPDGKSLAVARAAAAANGYTVEFPIGKVLHRSSMGLGRVRFSPDGGLLAFAEAIGPGGAVVVVDLEGNTRARADVPENELPELAWSADGREVWFSSSSHASEITAVDLAGRKRLVWREAGGGWLHDIAADGRLLMTQANQRVGMVGLLPGAERERDLSWFDFSEARDLSDDGTRILFTVRGARGGMSPYLRVLDASAPVRLGEGSANALSTDGRLALVLSALPTSRFLLVPIGAGETRELPLPGIPTNARFTPDGKRVVFGFREPPGSYVMTLANAKAIPVSKEGLVSVGVIAPDGSWFVCQHQGTGALMLCPLDGGAARPLGLAPPDWPIQWSADSRFLFAQTWGTQPRQVVRVELATGKRTPWRELMPDNAAGLVAIRQVLLTRDGRYHVYNYEQRLDSLYAVDGLR